MEQKTSKLIKSYIIEYLKIKFPNLKFNGKQKLFECPFKANHQIKNDELSANIYPPDKYYLHCFDPGCGSYGDIFDLVRKCEPNFAELENEDIVDYLSHILNIKTDEKVNNLLQLYSDAGFCIIPLKKQNQGKTSKEAYKLEWEQTQYRDIRQWKEWIDSNLGIGLNLGAKSNVIAVDIDSEETLSKVKHMLNNTLVQKTKRGLHYLFNYDKDFDNINHANLRNKGYEMEVRANKSYIVIAPTSIEGEVREWNNEKISDMPKELKKFLLDLIDKQPELSVDENIQKCIDNEKIDVVDLSGRRNDTFIKTAGVLRKWMNRKQLEKTLSFLSNNWIDKPVPTKELRAMLQQVEKYKTFDKKDIANKITQHLERTKQSTAKDLQMVLGYDLEDIHEGLYYLLMEERIYQFKNVYYLIEKINWTTEFVDKSRLIDFKMPFFDEYATFRHGDLIVIGGKSGIGKTHIAMNFVKKFVEQGKTPHYFPTEAGSRWAKIAMELGLSEGDFYTPKAEKGVNIYNPSTMELPDEAITVIDWLLPNDYSNTDKIYEKLSNQLTRHGGILIVFAQLRKDGNFFAPDMIDMFAALASKYRYKDDKDSDNTCFETTKIRESKVGTQFLTLPTHFDRKTKILDLTK